MRIGRICDNYSAFVNRNMIITTRLIKQGYQYTKLCKCMKKFSRKHKLFLINMANALKGTYRMIFVYQYAACHSYQSISPSESHLGYVIKHHVSFIHLNCTLTSVIALVFYISCFLLPLCIWSFTAHFFYFC